MGRGVQKVTEFVWSQVPQRKAFLVAGQLNQGCGVPRTRWTCKGHRGLTIDGTEFCASGCPAELSELTERCNTPLVFDGEKNTALWKWLKERKRNREGYYNDKGRRKIAAAEVRK